MNTPALPRKPHSRFLNAGLFALLPANIGLWLLVPGTSEAATATGGTKTTMSLSYTTGTAKWVMRVDPPDGVQEFQLHFQIDPDEVKTPLTTMPNFRFPFTAVGGTGFVVEQFGNSFQVSGKGPGMTVGDVDIFEVIFDGTGTLPGTGVLPGSDKLLSQIKFTVAPTGTDYMIVRDSVFPNALTRFSAADIAATSRSATPGVRPMLWDGNGVFNDGTLGGSGTWDTTTLRFDNLPGGTSGADVAWNNATNVTDTAVFGGNGGTVTVTTVAANGAPIMAGGLQFDASGYTLNGGTLVLSRPVVVVGTQTVPSIDTGTNDATINAPLAGTMGFQKLGTGTLTLGGANTYTGTTTIKGGTVLLDSTTGGSLISSTPLTLAGNGAFVYYTSSGLPTQTLGALTFSAGDGTVQVLNGTFPNRSLNFASLSARAPGATGTFTVTGPNFFDVIGVTSPPAVGFIDQGLFGLFGAGYAVILAGGGINSMNYGTTPDTATGNTILADKHIFLSGTPVTQNTISLRTIAFTGNNVNFPLAASQTLTLSRGGILHSGNTGSTTFSGGTGITTGGSMELVVQTQGVVDTVVIATPILASSTGGLTKSGPGTLTLSATNAYTGQTTVNRGILLVNGANGSSPITVQTEATLGGTGTVATIAGSGTVSPGGNTALPGLGAGILTATALDPSKETDFRFDIGLTGPVYNSANNDLLSLIGPTPFLAPLCATSRVLFDFQLPSLTNGMTFVGGFFAAGMTDFSSMLQGAAYVFTLNGAPVPVPNNFGVVFNGMVQRNINSVDGYVAQFRVIAPKVLNVDNGPWATGANWFTPGIPVATDNAVISGTGTHDISGSAFSPIAGVGSTEIQDISFTGMLATTLTNNSATDNMVVKLNGLRGANVPLIKTNANVLYTITGTGTGAHTLALQLKTGGEFRVEGTGQLDISAVIQESGGAFGITKTGAGILSMSAANTFTGAMTLNEGTVRVPTVANSGVASPLGAGSSLVFNGGTLEFTGASGTTNRAVTLTGPGTVSIPSISNALTLTGSISGSGSLIKAGDGTLTLTAVNSYTGPTLILTRSLMASSPGGSALPGNVTLGSNSGDNAFLRMGAANQFGPTSVLSFNQGNSAGKFELRGFDQTVAGLSSDADDVASIIQNEENGNPTLATLTINNTSDFDFTGIIRLSAPGTGAQLNLVKTGSGTQVIRNSPLSIDYFGTATINAGKLTFNFSGPTGSLGTNTTITVNAVGQLGLDGTWNMDRPITGGGQVMKLGTGTVTVSAMNTFTGGLNIMAGTLAAAGGGDLTGRLGQGAVTVNAGTTLRSDIGDSFGFFGGAPSVINVLGGTVTTGGSGNFRTTLPSLNLTGGTVISAGGNTGDSSGVFSLNSGSTVTTNASATTSTISAPSVGLQGAIVFTVADGSAPTDLAVSSALINVTYGGAAGGVTKAGTGTMTLSGANTFTGGLNIVAGTLAAAGGGTETGRLGQGAVTVNAGTTLRSDIGDSFGFLSGAPSVINVLGGTVTTGGTGNFRTTMPNLNLTGGTVTSAAGNTGDGSSGVFSLNAGATVTTNASATTSTISAPSVGLQGAIVFTVADGSAATDLAVSSALTNVTYGGAAGGVTKAGTGTMTLSGANTYTGATTVNAGTLVLSGSLPDASTIPVNGGTFLVNGTVGLGSATSAVGIGATVAGTGTINGTVTVAPAANVRPGDVGAGTLTVGGLTLGGFAVIPSIISIVSTGPALSRLNVTTTNALVPNGGANSVNIAVSGSTLALGQQVLIDYAGAIGGTGFGSFLLGTVPPRTTAALVNNAGNTSIDLNVTVADSPIWSGALGSVWSTAVLGPPKNWVLASSNATTTDFLTTDSVLFSDFATTTAVTINGADVTPALIRFNNTTKNYTVTGTNGISGFLPFTKDGTGTVTLSTTNSFTGPMTLNAGTLSIPTIADAGTNSALGAGSNITFNGGTLQFTGASGSTNRAVTLTGAGTISTTTALTLGGQIAGSGGLTKAGTGTLTLTGVNTFTGTTTLSQGNLVLGSAGGSALPGNVTLGTGVQAGIFLIMGASNQFGPTSVLTFNNGPSRDNKFELRGFDQTVAGLSSDADDTLSIIQNQESGSPPTATLTINNTSDYIFNGLIRTRVGGPLNLVKSGPGTQEIRNVAAAPHAFGTLTINAGKFTFNLSGATGTLAATTSVSIAAGATLGLDGTWTMNRFITGPGSVMKLGAGTVTISAANDYTGATTISGGTLKFEIPGFYNFVSDIVNNAAVQFNMDGTFNRNITGTGTISRNTGEFILATGTTANTQSWTLTGGRTFYNTQANLGTGAISVGGSGKLIKNSGGNLTLTNAVTLTNGGGLNNRFNGILTINNVTVPANGSVVFNLDDQPTSTLTLNGPAVAMSGTGLTVAVGGANATVGEVTLSHAIAGTALTKTGPGKLTLSGVQTYATLNANAGRTDLASALGTGASTINANAETNIGVSQTLAALNIGAGAVVTLSNPLPPSPALIDAGVPDVPDILNGNTGGDDASLLSGQDPRQAVPEPGSLSLLLLGALSLVRRGRRRG